MAFAEGEPLPRVTIDLSTRQFLSDWVTTTINGEISWRILLLLGRNPLEKIPKEQFSKVISQAEGKKFDHPDLSINVLKKLISADNGRPLIAKIRGNRLRGREVLGYSFLADVNLIGQEQPALPRKAEPASLPGMDEEEFSSLYDEQIDKTRQDIYDKVGNYQDAEDLAQEVYYKAWRANVRGLYKPENKPVGWIHTITHNIVVDHYEAKKQTTSLEEMDIPASESSDPALLLERQLEKDRLHQAINRLREDQQMVVRARYIKEMKYDEIAQMMDKSEVAVRVMLHRALLRLRDILPKELKS